MELDETLWQEFAAESEDHLDSIERSLGAAVDRAGVDSLFRAFHSLKGMSGALGAGGMQAVAHRCEDMLGLARQGRLAVAGPVADALLAAVDALRRQRTALLEQREVLPAPPGLLDLLGGFVAAPGGTARPGAAPPAAPPAVSPPPPPGLAALAESLAAAVPELGPLALGPAPDPAALAGELAEAARAAGAPRLAQALAATAAGGLPALGRLHRLLGLLAEDTRADAGAAGLQGAVRAVLGPADDGGLGALLAGLRIRLRDLMAGAASEPVVAAAREAAAVAAVLGLEALEALLLQIEDLADRTLDPDAAAILANTGPGLVEALGEAADGGLAAMRRLPPPGEETAEAEGLHLPDALARVLGPAGRAQARAAVAAGHGLFRARLGVPASAEDERAVQGWLAAQDAVLLTSRTLLETDPPTLDLLFASPREPEALEAARAAFDPAGRLLQALGPARAEAGAAAPAAAAPGATMRVRQETIDGIITLEAEAHAAALDLAEGLEDPVARGLPARLSALSRRLSGGPARELAALSDQLARQQERLARAQARLALGLRQLDGAVMELRLVAVGSLFARLPRVVRSVAQATAKQVELQTEGEEVRIDRSLVELLADPLLHLVRNAIDHGIEPPAARLAAGKPERARLRVRAVRRTGQVRIEVSDDGRGIDRAAVLRTAIRRGVVSEAEAAELDEAATHALLFRPGFSTSERISETSGRGVGLDVVQEAVQRAGGALEVTSRPGEGTSFALNLPLSAAMAAVLLVEVGGHPYALPAASVDSVLGAGAAGAWVSLAGLLGLPEPAEPGGVVMLRRPGGASFGLAVDRVLRRAELLLKPLHPALAALPGVGGVGVLGNGEPVVVLEPDGLASG